MDVNAEDVKLGQADARRWSGEHGDVFLYTWAFDQNLLVEACCGPEATRYLEPPGSGRQGGDPRGGAGRCTSPASDLASEDLVTNQFGKDSRMLDRDGCPLRSDIANMETDPDHHCWPGVTFLSFGTPAGSRIGSGEGRRTTCATKTARSTGAAWPLDLDAELPPTAVDTGYTRGDRTLWVDPADGSLVYVVDRSGVETWPRTNQFFGCA